MNMLNEAYLSGVDHIVLDWNGTLLDDLNLAIASINMCSARFGVATVGRDEYRQAFNFPIADFYGRLGFDFNLTPFAEIVEAYLTHFNANVLHCPLHDAALELLDTADRAGVRTSVLSASRRDILMQTVSANGLLDRFERIVGLTDNLAASKMAEASKLQRSLGAAPSSILYIGDTLHDYDVARALGWKPLLVSTGHQAGARLLESGAPVLSGLRELLPAVRAAQCRRDCAG